MSCNDGCLIFAMPQDVHGYAVGWALRHLDVDVRYFFTTDLPERAAIKFNGGDARPFELSFQCSRGWDSPSVEWCEPSNFRSAWFRRTKRPTLRADLGEGDKLLATDDWQSVVPALELVVQREVSLCLNPPDRRTGRALKCYHLWLAAAHGLTIPETMVTNDPDQIRDFVESIPSGGCIAKPLNMQTWDSGDGAPFVFTTTILELDDLEGVDLRSDPVILQPEIKKQYEVRITKIGLDFVAVKIDSQATAGGKLDFRLHKNWRDFGHVTVEIPEGILKSLRSVCDTLGLIFCTIDFIVDLDGRWIFLEINHMGNWLWVDLYNPEARLLDRMAQLLASGNAQHRYVPGSSNLSASSFVEMYEGRKHEIAAAEALVHANNHEGLAVVDR